MNETQLNVFNWKNVHIWDFVKVNYKRSLLFVVLPILISCSKTKTFTDYNGKIKTKNMEVYISLIYFSSIKHFNSLIFT